MTLAFASTECARQLDTSIHEMRHVIPGVGFAVPACSLHDHAVADWTREHGVTVNVHDDDELDLVQHNRIRPTQIVLRPTSDADSIRRAVNLGVTRYVLETDRQISRLAECAQRMKYVYLDSAAPLVVDEPRLAVVGLHVDVDASGDITQWASAVEQTLCRMAVMKTAGSPVQRMVLGGGSTDMWMNNPVEAGAIVRIVDEALHEGCERWRLRRPVVTVAPRR